MFDPKVLDQLAHKLSSAIPPGLHHLREDLERNFHAILQSTFSQMNLVSREEFEVQAALLRRTRQKLEVLEKQIQELEHKLQP